MERSTLSRLAVWKNASHRKPLILKGVGQVGKTWLLKEFGRRYYENTAYFSFRENPVYRQFFENTRDVDRILQNLTLVSGQQIHPGTSLVILDDVQDCPQAIQAMGAFYDRGNQYHVVCAGTLLDIVLSQPDIFPAGKVNVMRLNPMSFIEFLLANGDRNLAMYLARVNAIAPIPDAFFQPLVEKLKMYFITGGMPEPVQLWTQDRDVPGVQESLSGILAGYEQSFARHPNASTVPKISMIWNSIPGQLARENKKFQYRAVKEGARAREYDQALQFLVNTRLVHKIYRSTQPSLPLSAWDDVFSFKLYPVDVGVLRRLSQLSPSAFGEGNRLFREFNCALSESFLLQTLAAQFEVLPRYWSQTNPSYGVSFLIQRNNDLFPVEVVPSADPYPRGLRKFNEVFGSQTRLRIQYSLANLRLEGDVLNIPLFLADLSDRLIGLALDL